MSEKGADSSRQDVSGESGLLGQLGRDLVHKSFTIRKQGDDWEPYVGPRGGEGWKNPETGEVIYGDLGDVEEEDPSVNAPEDPDEESSGGEFVDVEPDDIDENQYVSIDGEVEGYIDGIERNGDDVWVEMDDGTSMWLEEGMEVSVNDSPETENPLEYEVGLVEDNISFEERTGYLSEDQVKDEVVDDLSRIKSTGLAENTVDHIDDVFELQMSVYVRDLNMISLSDGDMEDTLSHELGHAIMGANGFDIEQGANILATLMNNASSRGGLEVDRLGDNLVDVIDDAVRAGDLSRGYRDDVIQSLRDKESLVPPEQITLDKEFLKMKAVDSMDGDKEELWDLVEEVNSAMGKQLDALQEGNDEELFADQYAASNGQEVFAALNETLQQDGINPRRVEKLYDKYPELLYEYMEVFEPNDLQKLEIARLFQDKGPSGPIEENPF